MTATSSRFRRSQSGFTLIELVVAMTIASILITIAISSYMSSVRKSRRTEAKTALLDLAGREEQFFSTANIYAAALSDLGYATATVGGGYYTVKIEQGDAVGFKISATPATTDQKKDTGCLYFSINNTGVQTSTDAADGTGNDTSSSCWK